MPVGRSRTVSQGNPTHHAGRSNAAGLPCETMPVGRSRTVSQGLRTRAAHAEAKAKSCNAEEVARWLQASLARGCKLQTCVSMLYEGARTGHTLAKQKTLTEESVKGGVELWSALNRTQSDMLAAVAAECATVRTRFKSSEFQVAGHLLSDTIPATRSLRSARAETLQSCVASEVDDPRENSTSPLLKRARLTPTLTREDDASGLSETADEVAGQADITEPVHQINCSVLPYSPPDDPEKPSEMVPEQVAEALSASESHGWNLSDCIDQLRTWAQQGRQNKDGQFLSDRTVELGIDLWLGRRSQNVSPCYAVEGNVRQTVSCNIAQTGDLVSPCGSDTASCAETELNAAEHDPSCMSAPSTPEVVRVPPEDVAFQTPSPNTNATDTAGHKLLMEASVVKNDAPRRRLIAQVDECVAENKSVGGSRCQLLEPQSLSPVASFESIKIQTTSSAGKADCVKLASAIDNHMEVILKQQVVRGCGHEALKAWSVAGDSTSKRDAFTRLWEDVHIAGVDCPNKISAELSPHDIENIEWLALLYTRGVNCVLTNASPPSPALVAAFLQSLLQHEEFGPHLVVVPGADMGHWQSEINRLAPFLEVQLLTSKAYKKKELQRDWIRSGKAFVCIVSDENMSDCLAQAAWSLVIIDARQLFNKDLMQNQEAWAACRMRLLMIASPLPSTVDDLWAMLHCVNPVSFSTYQGLGALVGKPLSEFFESNCQLGLSFEQEQAVVSNLRTLLMPFVLHLERDMAQSSRFPPNIERTVRAVLTAKQQAIYQDVEDQLLPTLRDASGSPDHEVLGVLLKELQRAVYHPELFAKKVEMSEEVLKASGKMMLLDKILSMVSTPQHKIALVSHNAHVVDLLEKYLKWRCFGVVRVDASTHLGERLSQAERFATDPEIQILLLSSMAATFRLNLHVADAVVVFDSCSQPKGSGFKIGRRSLDRAFCVLYLSAPFEIERLLYCTRAAIIAKTSFDEANCKFCTSVARARKTQDKVRLSACIKTKEAGEKPSDRSGFSEGTRHICWEWQARIAVALRGAEIDLLDAEDVLVDAVHGAVDLEIPGGCEITEPEPTVISSSQLYAVLSKNKQDDQ